MTPRRRVWFLVALGCLLATPGLAQQGDERPDTWFVQRVTKGDVPLRVENFWSLGRAMRAESVFAGRPILTLVNEQFYYVIDPLAAMGMAIRRSPAALTQDQQGGRPFGLEGERLLRDGAEKVGVEQVAGRPCELYRLTDGRGRREVCLRPDRSRLPEASEEFQRSTSRTVQVRYLDWSHGFPVSPTFFLPDPRIELEYIEYDDYLTQAAKGAFGPAPVLYRELLHGL